MNKALGTMPVCQKQLNKSILAFEARVSAAGDAQKSIEGQTIGKRINIITYKILSRSNYYLLALITLT